MEKLSWQWMGECEAGLTQRFNRVERYPAVVRIFQLISRLGDGVFWYTLMVAMYLFMGKSALYVVLHMIAAGLTATLIYKWLKHKTLRPRPHQQFGHIHCLTAPLDRFSFPSGHTLHAVTFSLVAIYYYPSLAWLLVPFTLAVAASRLILGLHYPTDVLAGIVLGAAVASASFFIF
ncbi:phosphatase PAP2 family protein [Sulfuriferula thiophila]|uniref:phosphatase PAP2 family protein n=1 Tax=Sulfuriferula thiophila TaxID=1781211 RepID=UPI000F6146CA|nr:phosphatase PAP2 family protein [Sulfuriferula thiophila]